MLPVIRIINYKVVPNKLTLIYDELKCDGGDFGLGQDGIDPSLSAPPSPGIYHFLILPQLKFPIFYFSSMHT